DVGREVHAGLELVNENNCLGYKPRPRVRLLTRPTAHEIDERRRRLECSDARKARSCGSEPSETERDAAHCVGRRLDAPRPAVACEGPRVENGSPDLHVTLRMFVPVEQFELGADALT